MGFSSTQTIFERKENNLYDSRYDDALAKGHYWKVETREEQRAKSESRRPAGSKPRASAKERVNVVFGSPLKLSGAKNMWKTKDYYYHRQLRVAGTSDAVERFITLLEINRSNLIERNTRELSNVKVAWFKTNYMNDSSAFNDEIGSIPRLKTKKVEYVWVLDDLYGPTGRVSSTGQEELRQTELVDLIIQAVNEKVKGTRPKVRSPTRAASKPRAPLTTEQKKRANRKKILSMYTNATESRETSGYNPAGVESDYKGNKSVKKNDKNKTTYVWVGSLAVPKNANLSAGLSNVRRALDEIRSNPGDYADNAVRTADDLSRELDTLEREFPKAQPVGNRRTRRESRQPTVSGSRRVASGFNSSPRRSPRRRGARGARSPGRRSASRSGSGRFGLSGRSPSS